MFIIVMETNGKLYQCHKKGLKHNSFNKIRNILELLEILLLP